MFDDYFALEAAFHSEASLTEAWNQICARASDPARRAPKSRERMTGHISNTPEPVWETYVPLFDNPGLYVWGAWTGRAARIQYIGIVNDRPMRGRFEERYRNELAMARDYGQQLRALPDSFRVRGKLDLFLVERAGVKVDYNRPTRPARAERYAKIGHENLWFYPIPAPPPPARKFTLAQLETELVCRTSAELFLRHRNEEPRAYPLLNKVKVGPRFVDRSLHACYRAWLNGSWHGMGW